MATKRQVAENRGFEDVSEADMKRRQQAFFARRSGGAD